MNKPTTGLSYGQRIERVVAYITEHLDDPLSVERRADVACFSPHHFHRVYRAIAEETVAATVRRLRLHRAAVGLSRTREPFARIARNAGYGSVAAFSRAFVAEYGMPPAAYRSHTVGNDFVGSGEVRVFDLPAAKVASVIHKGPYAELEKPYLYLYKEWLPKSGYDPANQPCFEEYLNDCRTLPATEWLTEVSVPLVK